MIKKAIIPAAGLGTRFLPITKAFPKEMLPIIDKPALTLILEEIKAAGIEEVCLIISQRKELIKEYFTDDIERYDILMNDHKEELANLVVDNNIGLKLSYVYQEEQLGLGHAVLQCEEFIDNDPFFAVLLGDDVFDCDQPAIKQLINIYECQHASVLGCVEVSYEDTSKFGICIIDQQTTEKKDYVLLKGVVEKPAVEVAPSRMAISGRYILSKKIFEILKTTPPGKGGEIQLTDAILKLMEYEKVYAVSIVGNRYDFGSKFGFLKACIDYSLKNNGLKEELIKYLKEIIKKGE